MKVYLSLYLFIPVVLFGQSIDPNAFYNKGAEVTVQNGALLHIQGTLTNTNSGTINTDGVIEIKGDIDNTGATKFYPANPGSGTEKVVKFVGDSTQAIKGSFNTVSTNSFYNLVIDKSTAATAVELQTPVMVEGSLVFGSTTSAATYTPTTVSQITNNSNKGVIKTYDGTNTDYELYIANPAVDAINGYPALGMNRSANFFDSYVQTRGARGVGAGGLKRRVNHTGTTAADAYVYPIGTTAKGFEAIRFNFKTINGGIDDVRGMFCENATNPNGMVGHVTQYCIGCASTNLLGNDGINLAFGTTWAGSMPNPCATSGHPQQWVVLQDDLPNFGYWSFHASNSSNSSTYTVETFPRSFTDHGIVEPFYSEETWRTMHYISDVAHDPSTASADWNTDLFAVSDITDLVKYTRNTGCYDFHQPGVPGGVYTGFSHFTVKKSQSANALPVELSELTATPVNNEFISVDWNTAVEINNAGFFVERSTDGSNWSSLAWVAGHNNSTVQNIYNYPDHAVTPGIIYYYRLKQVDNDGSASYTDIVSARLAGELTFNILEFSPNPTTDKTVLGIVSSKDQDITVAFYDIIGRKVLSNTQELTKGNNSIDFNLGSLASGTYTAVISSANQRYTRKVVLAK